MVRILLILLVTTTFAPVARAQKWDFATKLGAPGHVALSAATNDREGNNYLLGSFTGSAQFDTIDLVGSGSRNIFLTKYRASGSVVWARVIASASSLQTGDVSANAIAVDANGAIHIAGNYTGTAALFGSEHSSVAPTEIYTAKLSNAGDLVWVKTAGGTGVGTFNPNSAYAIAVDSNGNSVIAGRYYRHALFDDVEIASDLPAEMFIASYDPSGSVRWALSGRGDFGIHNPASIAIDHDGNAYVTGAFFGHMGLGQDTLDAIDAEQKIFLSKVSPSGNVTWAQKVGNGGYYGVANSIAIDPLGDLLIAGDFRASLDLGPHHFSHNGTTITYAALVAKYTASGDLRWAAIDAATGGSSTITSVAADNAGIYVTGSYSGGMQLGGEEVFPSGSMTMFAARLTNEGDWIWARTATGATASSGSAVTVQPDNKLAVAGAFRDSIRLGSSVLTSGDGTDLFLTTLDLGSSGVRQPQQVSELTLYPNPANTLVHVSSDADEVQVLDVLGRRTSLPTSARTIDVSGLPDGVYVLAGNRLVVQH